MDRDDLPVAQLDQAFRGLARLRTLSNCATGIANQVYDLTRICRDKKISLIEYGCGDASLLRDVIHKLRAYKIDATGVGLDINKNAIALAQANAPHIGRFICADACEYNLDQRFDVGFTSLFLHHLNTRQTIIVLKRLAQTCRLGFVCFDLHRSITAWITTWMACRMVTSSPIVHNDGPRSIEAAYHNSELCQIAAQLDLRDVKIKSAFPLGYYLVSKQNS